MIDDAVRTKEQSQDGLLKAQQSVKARLIARKLEDRQRLQEINQLQEQQKQELQENKNPAHNNVMSANHANREELQKNEDVKMQIYYAVGYPERPRDDDSIQLVQARQGTENPQAKEEVRQADLRAHKEEFEQKKAYEQDGAQLDQEYADNRIQEARHKPGMDLNKHELDKKLEKEYDEVRKVIKNRKLTPKEKERIFNKLTGRTPSKEGHVKLAKNNEAVNRRVNAIKKKLPQKEAEQFKRIMERKSERIA